MKPDGRIVGRVLPRAQGMALVGGLRDLRSSLTAAAGEKESIPVPVNLDAVLQATLPDSSAAEVIGDHLERY